MTTPSQINPPHNSQRQSGAAILILVLILMLGLITLFTFRMDRKGPELEAERKTAMALAQAKEALIGYAASADLSTNGPRPGDLPCPDIDNDGDAEASCGNASGSTGQDRRLGRLPWKTLGLPDLRDGYGERLWYAVSNNFKNNTRTLVLNSETLGTITVRNSNGNVIFDATGTTGAIAVIFSPGSSLIRQGGYVQNRVCVPCNAQEVCTGVPFTNTPRCNPINYLDIAVGEDNSSFRDSDPDGFISGPNISAAGATILNDSLITITPGDLIPVLENRVAGEVRMCLTEYVAKLSNQARYPWAAPLNPAAAPSYSDASGVRFGRIPDTPFVNTKLDSGNVMDDSWTGNCNINATLGWWLNWKETVFYAVADAYKPVDLSSPVPSPGCGVTGTCLTVNPPSATASKQVTVFVAGRRLPGVAGGQPRTSNANKGSIANYLENQNATPADDIFERSPVSTTFNDVISFTP
ncbi:MAG: hypothetical protein AABY73_07545 [Pseudomonadota bacterium]